MNITNKMQYLIAGGVIGLVVGLILVFLFIAGLDGGLPNNWNGWGEMIVMMLSGFVVYVPSTVVGVLLSLFVVFLKNKGLLSRSVLYLFLVILGCAIIIGISFAIKPDLMKTLS